jgi:Domain of unknown function (DUF4129)
VIALAPFDVPVDLGREEAQHLAAQELADPAYHVDDPSLIQRVITWVLGKLSQLLDTAAAVTPGGWWGLLVLLALGVGILALVLWRGGPVRRTAATGDTALFVGKARSAADHRRAADQAAASARWVEAVLERYRAIVRSLEERTILDPRPGRTADEAAAEAALVLPLLAEDLRAAAQTFDSVAYGGRGASSTDDRFLRELDRAVQATTPRAHAAGARL